MSDDLILRLARRLNPDDAPATADSLRASSTFQGDLQWLGRLFAAADAHQLPPVPEELTAALVLIADSPEPGVDVDWSEFEAELAIMIHDSRADAELAGVRGPTAATEAWSAIYSTAAADLVVDGTPQDSDATAIRGHVLSRSGEQGVVQVIHEASNQEVLSNMKGIFDLGVLEPGEHELRIAASGIHFTWILTLP